MLMFSTPIIGLISHPALYILLLFVVLLIALKNKMTDCLLILLPLLLTIMFIIIGPVFHGHPRYAFPIIYSMPIVYSYTKYRVNSLTNLNESWMILFRFLTKRRDGKKYYFKKRLLHICGELRFFRCDEQNKDADGYFFETSGYTFDSDTY